MTNQKEITLADGKIFKIESGVKVPPPRFETHRWRILIDQMDIDDSVSMPYADCVRLASAVNHGGGKMSYRTSRDGKGRIWLVKKPKW